jgi:hypothetical protein
MNNLFSKGLGEKTNQLLEKVVVERHKVEIHYRFPVSSNRALLNKSLYMVIPGLAVS